MRKKLFILILIFFLFFILTSSGWSKQWPHYIRYGHDWEDACMKPVPSEDTGQQTYGVIKFTTLPFFMIFKVTEHKTSLKTVGGNNQNVKLSNSNPFDKKWTNNSKAFQKR